MKITKYLWYIPALYVAYMFGNKIIEGFAHSEEFIAIISVIPPLKPVAYDLTPFVGLFDFCVGLALLLNPFITKSNEKQKLIFVWAMLWPFVPASLRYFGGVSEFEIVEVLSISFSAFVSYMLWVRFLEKK
jgi:hypothetical protein